MKHWVQNAASKALILFSCLAYFSFTGVFINAAEVVLKIETTNPIDKAQSIKIKYSLPAATRIDDVIDANGLALEKGPAEDKFYLRKDVILGPREVRTFAVRMRDVWTIPRLEFQDLRDRIGRIVPKLKKIKDVTRDRTGDLIVLMIFRKASLQLGIEGLDQCCDVLQKMEKRHLLAPEGISGSDIQQLEDDCKVLKDLRAGLTKIEQMIEEYEKSPEMLLSDWMRTVDEIKYAPVANVRLLPVTGGRSLQKVETDGAGTGTAK